MKKNNELLDVLGAREQADSDFHFALFWLVVGSRWGEEDAMCSSGYSTWSLGRDGGENSTQILPLNCFYPEFYPYSILILYEFYLQKPFQFYLSI